MVVGELVSTTANGIPVALPDFYTYFSATYQRNTTATFIPTRLATNSWPICGFKL